jgi:hypothetical protein
MSNEIHASSVSDVNAQKLNDPRKATDIVLSVEEKLNTLIKLMYSYDLNVKLVLDRTNKIYKYIERLEETEKQMLAELDANTETNTNIVSIPAGQKIEEAKEAIGQRRTSRITAPQQASAPIQKQAPSPVKNVGEAKRVEPEVIRTQDNRQSTNSIPDSSKIPSHATERKIPVTQRITDDKGRDIFMAEIKITDSGNNIVANAKTNALGRWQAQLKPGKYTVNMIKTDTTTKNKTEVNQSIEIPHSNAAITLPVAIVKR